MMLATAISAIDDEIEGARAANSSDVTGLLRAKAAIARADRVPKLADTYIGRAGDFETTADRIEHLSHIAEHGAPLPADDAIWLIAVAKKALAERDDQSAVISIAADIIATASESLEAVMAPHLVAESIEMPGEAPPVIVFTQEEPTS